MGFLLKDIEAEKKFGFKLGVSQEKALSRHFLEGWKFWVSRKVQPSQKKMKMIAESAGGQISKEEDEPLEFDENLIIICDESERRLQKRMEDRGFYCYNSELILTGVMRQKLQ